MNKNFLFLLTQLKAASMQHREIIILSYKVLYLKFLPLFYKEGLIQHFIITKSVVLKKFVLVLYLRYSFNKPVVQHLKIFSKPSLYLYVTYKDICSLYDKKYVLFVSTIKGILTSFECKIHKIGGVALFIC